MFMGLSRRCWTEARSGAKLPSSARAFLDVLQEREMSEMLLPISRRAFLAGSAAFGGLVMLHPFSARAQANQAHLRIMETTDIHVNVLPYD
jgi:hypothetical protein